uniref:DUF4371 domain-containing protein n=1 Tax=Latimeria chalumnae TaxID=7897 RepID=H3B064_LATCH
YQKWVEAEIRIKRHQGIDKKNQELINKEAKHWTNIPECLMSIILFLAEHNTTFQGSSECLFKTHNGNFLGLVQFLGKFDTVLQERLCDSDHYCGKTIQNEQITLLAKTVKDNIIKESKYFSVIMDCTPDSHREQLSFTICFVDTSEDIIRVKEHSVEFHTVQNLIREGLKGVLMDMLDKCGLDIQECRGQGYDNGANVKGRNKGILQINLRTFFMPCGCHSLKLMNDVAAVSSTKTVSLFGILQQIYTLFSELVLRDHVRLTLKPVCVTRWECRVESVRAVKYQTVNVHDALVALVKSEGWDPAACHEANTHASQLTDFKFLIAMVVWYDILLQVNLVSKSVQRSQSLDIATAVIMMEVCFKYMINYRETGYATAITTAKELATELGAEPVFKHTTQIHRKKHQFDYESREEAVINPEEKFKMEFFHSLLDTVRVSLEDCFIQMR